ncbi:MAG: O-antigen ligase family protein [Deltaproteobacteria bacterium]|nr:O-antigen ligase family protein [Deltaproteobacteria bacterium]
MPYVKRTKRLDENGEPLPSSTPPRSSLAVEIPIYALVFATPLALGTVHLASVAGMLAMALLAFAALLVRTRRRGLKLRLFPLGVALLAAACLCALQLLPLPPSVPGALGSGAAEVHDTVLEGTPLAGAWRPISLAPPSTALELLKYIAYALAFIVVVNYFTDRHRARRLLKAVAWSGFCVALVGFFSKLFMAESIYGLYELPHRESFFFASFVNPNHLAGFLALCSPVALGLALSARERQDRALFGFMGVIVGAAVFMSLSRGGIVAYSAALCLLFLFAATRSSRRLQRLALVQALAAAVLLVAGYLAYDTIQKELRTLGDIDALREETKIQSWKACGALMADHPVLGIGRGAYAAVYPRYKTLPARSTFTHAENQVLQYMCDWGPVPGALFAGVLFGCLVLGLVRTRTSYTMAGCTAGVFAVLSHNLVDFNMETGGVMMPLVVVFGVLAASPFSHAGSPSPIEGRLRLRRWLAWGIGAAGLGLGAWAVPVAAGGELGARTDALLALQEGGPAEPCDPSPLGQAACALMDDYPADYLAPLVLGKAALGAAPPRIDRAGHWLARAILLNPTDPSAHRLTGRALFWAGKLDQALVEYRLAARYDPGLLTTTVTEVLRLTGKPDAAIRATPDEGKALLRTAAILRTLGREQAAARAARKALERDSTLLGAMDMLGELALANGHLSEAAVIAQQAIDVDAQHDPAWVLKGRVLERQGQPEHAEQAWREGLLQVPDSTLIAYTLVDFYLRRDRPKDAERTAARMQTFVASDDRSQARLLLLVGRIKEAREQYFEARQAYRQAVELMPEVLPYVYRLARLEEKIGNWDEAERLYTKLADAHFRDKEMHERIGIVRKARELEHDRSMWETWVEDKKEKP